MLHAAQIRAARGLLDWRQRELAKSAGIGLATLRRIEAGRGPALGNVKTLLKIQKALEAQGIAFTGPDLNGVIGVTLAELSD